MDIKIIYEDKDILAIEKPAGLVVFPEGQTTDGTLIDELINRYPELRNVGEPPRYGIAHRLDKDTSGILLVAKTTEALIFLQKQFKNRGVDKRYICLVYGTPKDDFGTINTLIARSKSDPRKQKAYINNGLAPKSAREAITHYKVIEKFKDYSLLEVKIETGRRHQIRCHLSYLQHPIVGDKLYSFKNQTSPEGLSRQFLHAKEIKIQLPNGDIHEFKSELPEELKKVLINLEK